MKAPARVIRRAAAVAGLASSLAACVPSGLPETALPPDNAYRCQDGALLRVARAPDGSAATVVYGDRTARLARMDSPAQEKYGDGPTTLYLDGDRALLIADSFVAAGPCVSTAPLPVVQPWRPQ
ncbi:MAG: hypothetical protein U1F58_03610 [Burkholderiales bacterium]